MKCISSRIATGLAGAGLSVALVTMLAPPAVAHAVCGNRVFPATLTMDDPGVGDELSLPTIQYLPLAANNGNSAGHSIDYGFEWDKRITEHLGVAINGDYFTQHGGAQNLHGWDNFTGTLKYELPCWDDHEFLASVGVIRNFARTGSSQLINAGAIANVSFTAPTLYLGKGLGDLPIGYLRPLAVTGELSRQFSDSPEVSPDAWTYSTSLQYSIPYLQQHVEALNLPPFMGRLIPLVEISMSNPDRGPTTGTIAPGILYEADTWQVGAEALIPANSATRQLQGTGFIVQLHLFLDDIFPDTIGKPLFGD